MAESSLVLELQSLAQTSKTDIPELLRRAKVVAVKLRLPDLTAWLEHELNGYPDNQELPRYRKAPCELRMRNPFRGLMPVVWGPKSKDLAEHFSTINIRQSIGTLDSLLSRIDKSGHLESHLTPQETGILIEISDDFRLMPAVRVIYPSAIDGIFDSVRNRILEWALNLETQGVLGKGMTFTTDEKRIASTIHVTNYGQYVQGDQASVAISHASPGANVTSASGGAAVEQRLNTAVSRAEQDNAGLADALRQIAGALATNQHLPALKKEEASEQLAFIAEQCAAPAEQRQPHSVIKPMLLTLRETLGLSADLLQVWGTFGPVICAALSVNGVV
ncbi:hypothetical protein CYFUS_005927 [Cystobacter fuscus]|uniref:AbiTii domain-containing protein n=1 Tax=Cystobacter fuscus TaxID=43 RepID=A0A250JA91_9BACT|nr:hypothetical protein [Cystobacter fuscus]ATB40478.1 hypothetical protein CYFUS_005927 [Cystobacter fuscus]